MNNLRILITGGAGFVGSNLSRKILEIYPESNITILDNFFTGNREVIPEGVNVVQASTWQIQEYFPDTPGLFDIVYHFGEYSRIVPSFDDIDYVLKTNLHGTTRVLEMCRKWGSKLIYSASSSKLGNNGKDENLSPYSWMKSKIVELIKNYHDWWDLKYEICYFFNVYGPGQIQTGDYATVVGIFERQYLSGEPLTVVSPGTQSRDFTHIEDIVEGVIKASESNLNKEWYLRSGKVYSIIELAEMFNHEWKMIPERRGERFTAELMATDTEELLNWYPKWDLKDYVLSKLNEYENQKV